MLDFGRSVFTAQGHKKRVSGGQKLRFACAKPWADFGSERFPCAGPQKTRRPRSKFAFHAGGGKFCDLVDGFSVRRAAKNASLEVKICVSTALTDLTH